QDVRQPREQVGLAVGRVARFEAVVVRGHGCTLNFSPSCRGLSRAMTSFWECRKPDADGRNKPRHDEGLSLQPPLPALETFQVFKTLALVAGAAEVEFLDVLVVAQFVGA